MIRLRHYIILCILCMLVVTALNISNGAINQLTGENRQAIIGVDYGQDNICFYMMGQSYDFDRDELYRVVQEARGSSHQLADSIMQYFIRYVKIFQVVFLR